MCRCGFRLQLFWFITYLAYVVHLDIFVSPGYFMIFSSLWPRVRCDGIRGRGRVAELSLCIVHCHVYCCTLMLHNSTSSSNRSVNTVGLISHSLALFSSCLTEVAMVLPLQQISDKMSVFLPQHAPSDCRSKIADIRTIWILWHS